MLAYQLMLTVKRGLPLSRLLSNQKTDARPSSTLKSGRMEVEIKKEEKKEDVAMSVVKEEKEEVNCSREGVPSSESNHFTLRNLQAGANQPSSQPLPQGRPPQPPSQAPPLLSSSFAPLLQTPKFCQMPAAYPVFCGACMTWGTVVPVLLVQ